MIYDVQFESGGRQEVAQFPKHRNCEPKFLRNWAPYPIGTIPQNRNCEPQFPRNRASYPSGMIPPKKELGIAIPQESCYLS